MTSNRSNINQAFRDNLSKNDNPTVLTPRIVSNKKQLDDQAPSSIYREEFRPRFNPPNEPIEEI